VELGAVVALAYGLEPQQRFLNARVFGPPEINRLWFVLGVGTADATVQHLAELACSRCRRRPEVRRRRGWGQRRGHVQTVIVCDVKIFADFAGHLD